MSNKDVRVECEYYKGTMRYNCNLFCDEIGNNKNCQDFDCVIKQLQLKNKMIELMAESFFIEIKANPMINFTECIKTQIDLTNHFKQQAIKELEVSNENPTN